MMIHRIQEFEIACLHEVHAYLQHRFSCVWRTEYITELSWSEDKKQRVKASFLCRLHILFVVNLLTRVSSAQKAWPLRRTM
jgi:hypothetical protein